MRPNATRSANTRSVDEQSLKSKIMRPVFQNFSDEMDELDQALEDIANDNSKQWFNSVTIKAGSRLGKIF